MRVQAYRNLNRATWSIRVAGKVISYRSEVCLAHVEFKVSEKQRQAVIEQHRRKVHAYVVGELVEQTPSGAWQQFTYNPFRDTTFVDCASGQSVHSAGLVHLASNGKAYYQP